MDSLVSCDANFIAEEWNFDFVWCTIRRDCFQYGFIWPRSISIANIYVPCQPHDNFQFCCLIIISAIKIRKLWNCRRKKQTEDNFQFHWQSTEKQQNCYERWGFLSPWCCPTTNSILQYFSWTFPFFAWSEWRREKIWKAFELGHRGKKTTKENNKSRLFHPFLFRLTPCGGFRG